MVQACDCAALFDLDGVIVDTKEAHFAAFRQLGHEEGYAVTEAQFRYAFGRRNEEIFPYLYQSELPRERVAWLADRKEAIFREMIAGCVQPLPGVTTLLPALRDAGFHLAIGTSTPRENVMQILGELHFSDFFAAIISAEDVSHGKPHPEVFSSGAQRLGIAPAHCVVVEDAVAGVEAALRGGMQALAVTTNHSREALADAHRVVDSLAEVGPEDFLALVNDWEDTASRASRNR